MGRGLAAILAVAPRDDGRELRRSPSTWSRPTPTSRAAVRRGGAGGARGVDRGRACCSRCSSARWPAARYELIAGERRWRAAHSPGSSRIPAIVRERDDAGALEVALIENMAREDLNPVEEARPCAALTEELGLSREEVGQRVGRSRVAVSNLLRLLDLPDEALELIDRRRRCRRATAARCCWRPTTPTAAGWPARRRGRLVGACARVPRPRRAAATASRGRARRAAPAPRPGEAAVARSTTRSGPLWAPTSRSRPRGTGYQRRLATSSRSEPPLALPRRHAAPPRGLRRRGLGPPLESHAAGRLAQSVRALL